MGASRSQIMRVHSAYLNPLEPGQASLRADEAKHLIRVLRIKPNAELRVFDGMGNEAKAIVQSVDKYSLKIEVFEVYKSEIEPELNITLAISLLKADKLAEIARKSTELGVKEIKLFYSQYSDLQKISENKLERLNRIVLEAAKQSGRAFIPKIQPPVALRDIALSEINLLAHPYVKNTLADIKVDKKDITVFSGPEGGFSEAEIDDLGQNIKLIKLGPRILRAETAPIAIISALLIPNAI